MKKNLRNLLHAINTTGEKRNVNVDGRSTFTVTPPVSLTSEGFEHFRKALDAEVVENDTESLVTGNDYVAWKAFQLLSFLACCSGSYFTKWFEGDGAMLI